MLDRDFGDGLRRGRILLVEDQRELARHVKRILAHEGFDTTICHTCAEAEDASGGFDTGIFDLSLPDGSGLVLAARLRHQIGKAVFYSASDDERTIRQARRLGEFVNKINGIDALRRALGVPQRSQRGL